MFKNIRERLSGLFHASAKTAEDAHSPAIEAPVQESTLTPGAFNAGAVIVLPPEAYQVSDLSRLITTSGGKPDQPAYWRIIGSGRAGLAKETGTDRTSRSRVHTLRGDTVTMQEHGLRDPADVTYLHRMPETSPIPAPQGTQSILVYSAAGIKNLTTTNPAVPFPNGSFFHFTGDPKDSLLAVITSALPPTPALSPHAPDSLDSLDNPDNGPASPGH